MAHRDSRLLNLLKYLQITITLFRLEVFLLAPVRLVMSIDEKFSVKKKKSLTFL